MREVFHCDAHAHLTRAKSWPLAAQNGQLRASEDVVHLVLDDLIGHTPTSRALTHVSIVVLVGARGLR